MALKFRRGTTAQQSGSLAFGEPFVNTTLGTLLVGGPNGDIVLSTAGTGSTGNFGPISGSGLDITGNANIAGNLTLGGTITIGDTATDNVVVNADLSSSLIPDITNAFDLGSTTKVYRNVYATSISGAIAATNGVVSGSSQVIGILDSLNTFSGSQLTRNSALATVTGSLISSASAAKTTNDSQDVSITNLNSTTASLLVETANLELFSGSQLTQNIALATITGSLISSASAAKTTNDSQDVSITNLNTFSGSQLTQNTALATISGSLITSASNLTQRVAANEAVSASYVRNNSANTFNGNQTVSGSLYVTQDLVVLGSSSIQHVSSSTLNIGTNLITVAVNQPSVRFGGLAVIDSGSSGGSGSFLYDSVQDEFIFVHRGNGTNVTSSHFLLGPETYDNLGNETYIGQHRVIKGSGNEHIAVSNIFDNGAIISLGSNVEVTGSLTLTGTVDGVDVSVLNSNINSFSASALSRLGVLEVEATNLELFTSSINTTIKNRLNAETVVSGSSQVIGILSSLNSYTASNDTTNTTQNSRLDQLSTASGSAISRLSTLEIETANLETFSASALTRLGVLEVEATNLETFSSSALTRLSVLEVETANLETFTSSINTTIKTRLNAETVISGSSQVTAASTTGFATAVKTQLDANTVVSGSSQINVASTTGDIALGTRTSGNYVASLVAGTNITLSNNSGEGATPTIGLTNNTISGIALGSNLATLTIGTGLSGTSYNGSGAVTIANTGVLSNVAGTGVSVSGATGNVTISIGQAVGTSDNVRFNSLGIGMAASATAGRIDATNDIVAFSSSDIRFKENIKPIENAIDKIRKISGNTYDWKAENKIEHGYEGNDVGVIAQEIEAVLPQLVQTRESGYKAVKYDKLVALLIEGIKEQQLQIEQLRIDLDNCRNNKGL